MSRALGLSGRRHFIGAEPGRTRPRRGGSEKLRAPQIVEMQDALDALPGVDDDQ